MSNLDAGPQHLVGRSREADVLRGFVGDVTIGGGSLLIAGDPGVGKSALVTATAQWAVANGVTVLRLDASEYEAEIPFASVNQLLYPVADRFEELEQEQRDAVRVALGFGTGPTPSRLLLLNGFATLLRRIASGTPLLIVIDDLQWLDRSSAELLSFAARRLIGSKVGLLATYRTGSEMYFDQSGLPEYRLGPLQPDDAAALVDLLFPQLERAARARVLDTAQGNPLALAELPRALDGSPRSRISAGLSSLPLTQRLSRVFSSRIGELPAATQLLLLTLALEGNGDLTTLALAGGVGYQLGDLEEAERMLLVNVDELHGRVTFRHPLIRSAVVEMSTSAQRRNAHASLADAFAEDIDRRAWHAGQAAIGTDEEVAALLEHAAERDILKGQYDAAVAMLSRAAELSPSPTDAGRRLAAAAYIGAEALADTESAAERLDQIKRIGGDASTSLNYASVAVHVMLNDGGDIDSAHRLLTSAIRRAPDDAPELAHAASTLALLAYFGGKPELWAPFYETVERMPQDPPADLRLAVSLFADPARTASSSLDEFERRIRHIHEESNPEAVQNLAAAAFYVDRLSAVRSHLWRRVIEGRQGGPVRRYLVALMDICVDSFFHGEWEEATALADEGMTLVAQRDVSFFAWYFRYHEALLAGARGDFDLSHEIAEQMLGWAGPRGVGTAQAYARHALTLAHLAQSDFENAFLHASAISPAGTLASHAPVALWVALDLVEAAVRSNRREDARRHVDALLEAGVANISSRLALTVAGSVAMVSDDVDAAGRYAVALDLPAIEQWPFDVARIRLAFGEHLRRVGARVEARAQLNAALESFRKIGATPWAERAEREIRASGHTLNARSAEDVNLTAQEWEIARLAAAGLTNKEIAAQLFLSPRTVGGHLYRAFPKLGISSRAALRDALTRHDAGED